MSAIPDVYGPDLQLCITDCEVRHVNIAGLGEPGIYAVLGRHLYFYDGPPCRQIDLDAMVEHRARGRELWGSAHSGFVTRQTQPDAPDNFTVQYGLVAPVTPIESTVDMNAITIDSWQNTVIGRL